MLHPALAPLALHGELAIGLFIHEHKVRVHVGLHIAAEELGRVVRPGFDVIVLRRKQIGDIFFKRRTLLIRVGSLPGDIEHANANRDVDDDPEVAGKHDAERGIVEQAEQRADNRQAPVAV